MNKRKRLLRSLPAPEPAAGIDAYLAEREAALASDPRKRANYDRYLASQRRSQNVDYLPIKLDVENVSRCNFRCTMCMVGSWPKGQRAGDMSFDAFKALIDDQYGLVEIKLQGIGEPLLQRDEYFRMIRYARDRRIWVRTTTNASLLHLKENYKRLIDSGVNEVQISIDGATKDAYERIRLGAVFSRVVKNCSLINAYCNSLGIQRTKMWTVVQRGNCDQLEELVDLASATGFKDQVFSLELSDWGREDMRECNAAVNVEDSLEIDQLLRLVERGKQKGVRVRFWNVTEKYSATRPDTLCPWPFERAFVSSDGRIVPCCYISNPDVYQIGSPIGKEQSFTDVWQGPAFASFRRMHLQGELPSICRCCYSRDPH